MKVKLYLLIALLGITLYSCENVVDKSDAIPYSANQITVTVIDTVGDVNLDVIKHVAESYIKSTQTRNSIAKKIKEIIPVNDEQGVTSIYIVNYENNQGYLILSGINEYQPVLAFSEKGNFNIALIDVDGTSLWLQEQQGIIKNITTMPDSIKWRNKKAWNKFFEKETSVQLGIKTQTRSGISALEREISDYIEESLAQWRREGYTIYPYSELSTIFSGDDLDYINETINNHAEDRYCGGVNGTVFLRTKKIINNSSKGPLLQSQWNQVGGYEVNGYPAGCTAVAMGQIMRYHEFPVLYNWSAMAYNYSTSLTVQLLTEIGKKVNMNYDKDGSTAFISDVCNAFKQYGYSQANILAHSLDRIKHELLQDCPVYMTGTNNGTPLVAHAWVCDGYNDKETYESFDLMVLDRFSTDRIPPYYSIWSNSTNYSDVKYLHMNWGWGGSNDGYFYQDNVNPPGRDYSVNRYNIVNISPTR